MFPQQDAWAFMDYGDPLSLNLYTYCGNNPVMYVDPSGHDAMILLNEDFKYTVAETDIYLGHMGALVQNKEGTWYYFSFGQDYMDFIEFNGDPTKMTMEEISQTAKYGGGTYDANIFLKGDFSQSVAFYKQLYKFSEFVEYSVIDANCAQVALDGIYQGVLSNGINVGEFLGNYQALIPIRDFEWLKKQFEHGYSNKLQKNIVQSGVYQAGLKISMIAKTAQPFANTAKDWLHNTVSSIFSKISSIF